MTAYLIVNYDVDDAEGYGEYQKGAMGALRIGSDTGVKALDGDTETIEGTGAGKQTVILEFESKDKAREIYNSGEYQAIVGQRHAATSNHFAILVDTM